MGGDGPRPSLLYHLADLGEGEQLQPVLGNVPLMSEGEVLDNVRPSNCLPQQEERDLQQLQAQGEQAAVENMR